MNPSELFIKRPIATSLLMIAILFAGLLAFRLLPISALPEIEYPTIQVSTFYPGAGPDVMASLVTAPLEKQFGQMTGLTQMTSNSSTGSSLISLKFGLDTGMDVAEQEVQAAINSASTYLPTTLPNPPIYNKVNPADAPIVTLALTSKELPISKVQEFAEVRLVQKLSQLNGVGLVSMSGGQRPAIRVQCNPTKLASYGLTLDDVRIALTNACTNQPKGSFDGGHALYSIEANDQLLTSAEFESLIISYKNNAPLRLKDVATVVDGAEDTKQNAEMNGKPAVILNIHKQPGANVIQVVDDIKRLLPQLKASLPAAIDVTLLTDRTITIRASVHDAQFDLFLSILLVILVVYVFLRSASATVIPSVVIPLSLVGTCVVMYLAGFSVNNLSLMALTIATGFVVDDAIVMIENISRYIEDGDTPLMAALKGSKQIGFTIISLTISLIAVMIPLFFMGDLIGRLFQEFALTLTVTILLSAFISLTLTPMMCARLLHHTSGPDESTDMLSQIIETYRKTLVIAFNNQRTVLAIFMVTVCITGALFYTIPKGFFPTQDTSLLQGISEAPQEISFDAMVKRQSDLTAVILKDPAVVSVSSFVGIDGTNVTLNSGRFLINLKPYKERGATITDVMGRIGKNARAIHGINLFLQPVQDLTINDRVSRNQYQYSLNSPDADAVDTWTTKFIAALKEHPILSGITSDQQNQGLRKVVTINRETASRLGITTSQIDSALYNAFGQRQILTLFTQSNQYHVILEILPFMQNKSDALHTMYLTASNGNSIPFNAFTTVSDAKGPLVINRQGQFPVSILSFNIVPPYSLGDAIALINQTKDTIGLPASVRGQFEGTAKIFQNSLANEGWLLLAAIVVVYIVLGVLYESYIHPVTILSTLPSAGIGALISLWFMGQELSIIALIGIILLIGIVKKNAILMIDFALEQERNFGKSAHEAIFEACLLRFRPILMTTMAALLGALPLAVSTGIGSELRQPLGITLIGGLAFSQLLTLYTTPIIYLAFDRWSRYLRGAPVVSKSA